LTNGLLSWLRLPDERWDFAANAIYDKGEGLSRHVLAATLEARQILSQRLEDLLTVAVLILNFSKRGKRLLNPIKHSILPVHWHTSLFGDV
jgi:hypothetical protein